MSELLLSIREDDCDQEDQPINDLDKEWVDTDEIQDVCDHAEREDRTYQIDDIPFPSAHAHASQKTRGKYRYDIAIPHISSDCLHPSSGCQTSQCSEEACQKESYRLDSPDIDSNRNAAFSELPTAYRLRPNSVLFTSIKTATTAIAKTMTATGKSNTRALPSAIKPSGR